MLRDIYKEIWYVGVLAGNDVLKYKDIRKSRLVDAINSFKNKLKALL